MNIDFLNRDNLVEVHCSQCNAELLRRPDMLREHSFCTPECRQAHRRGGIVINTELKKEVKRLRKQGWKYRQLSECFNLSMNTIMDIVKGYK